MLQNIDLGMQNTYSYIPSFMHEVMIIRLSVNGNDNGSIRAYIYSFDTSD